MSVRALNVLHRRALRYKKVFSLANPKCFHRRPLFNGRQTILEVVVYGKMDPLPVNKLESSIFYEQSKSKFILI